VTPGAVVGDRLPEFQLPDLAGRSWSGADLLGERAVVFCFATW
jgi:peroxiredoxin